MKKQSLSKADVFKTSKTLTGSELAKLLEVNKSNISRSKNKMAVNEDGKIILHELKSLMVITEIMDRKMDVLSRFTPEYADYLELYKAVSAECRPLFMKKYYRG